MAAVPKPMKPTEITTVKFDKVIGSIFRSRGMFSKMTKIGLGSLAALASISACSPKSSGPCSSTQVVVGGAGAIDSSIKAAPLGGFINVGPRACTATLSLVSSSESSIVVNAYSALHCFREDLLNDEKISLSVYVPGRSGISSGYLQKIPVADEFFVRRKQLLDEIDKLANTEASERIRDIMKIELPYFFEDASLVRSNAAAGQGDKLMRNICLSSSEDKLTVQNSQQTCWSSLDTGARTLEIKASSLPPVQYRALRNVLEQHSAQLKALFRNDPRMAESFNLWSNRIHGLTGLWRLTNYSPLAYFLNKDMCAMITGSNSDPGMCTVRSQLISLADKFMVEIDVDGKKRSILAKADELGFGINQNLMTEKAVELVNLMPKKAFDKFHEVFLAHRNDIKQRVRIENEKALPLSAEYVIAANQIFKSGSEQSMSFGLLRGRVLTPDAVPSLSRGMSSKGTLRFYVNNSQLAASFGKSDSGSMITFAGIIPLLVLNSVDDEPTSGGASILALPEASSEEVTGSSLLASCQ